MSCLFGDAFPHAAVDGAWSGWTLTHPCNGTAVRFQRSCSDPLPDKGGNDCEGEDVKALECRGRGGGGGVN